VRRSIGGSCDIATYTSVGRDAFFAERMRQEGWQANWPVLLVRLWSVGAAFAVASLIVGLIWAAWFARRATPLIAPEWSALQADAMIRMGVTARVRLLISNHVGVPVACGILRPALVFPIEAERWDRERRTVVLLHELAHVKRRDCLMQVVAHLAWALHWFNPLAFLAVSRLRAEQERACDDLVLSVGTPATAYAGHLCEIASTARRVLVPVWSTLAIARPSRLEARVTAILDDARSRKAPSRRYCAAVAGLVCLSVVPLGALRASVAARAIVILPSATLTALAPYSALISAPGPAYVKEEVSDTDATLAPMATVATLPTMRAPVQELTAESGRAFLQDCFSCHTTTRRTANLAIEELNVERVSDNPEIWEKVVRRLRTGCIRRPAFRGPAARRLTRSVGRLKPRSTGPTKPIGLPASPNG
jgi:beta-lactamase regulating signal transducer with metallopeptidase domain